MVVSHTYNSPLLSVSAPMVVWLSLLEVFSFSWNKNQKENTVTLNVIP